MQTSTLSNPQNPNVNDITAPVWSIARRKVERRVATAIHKTKQCTLYVGRQRVTSNINLPSHSVNEQVMSVHIRLSQITSKNVAAPIYSTGNDVIFQHNLHFNLPLSALSQRTKTEQQSLTTPSGGRNIHRPFYLRIDESDIEYTSWCFVSQGQLELKRSMCNGHLTYIIL